MSVQIHRKEETKSIDSTPREAPTYKSLDGPKHTDIDTDDFEYKNDTENSLSNDNSIIPDKKRKETAKKLFKEMMDDPELMELMYKKMNKQKLKEGRQKRAKTQELVTQNYGPQRPHAYSATTIYSGNNGNNNQIYSNNNRMNINGNNKVINYQPNMYPNNNNRHVLYTNNNVKSHAQTTRPNLIYYGSYNNVLRAQQNGVPLNNFQRIVSPQYQGNVYQNRNNNSNKGNMQLNQNNGYSQPNISQSKSNKSITQTTTYQSSQPSGQAINYSISSMNNMSKTHDTQLDKVPPPPKMPNMPPVLQMNKYSQTQTQTVVKLDEGDTPASSSTDETESTSDE